MSSRSRISAVVLLLVFFAAVGTAVADDASIVEAYPNTYEDGSAGEYVAVEFDATDTTGWVLEDRFRGGALPNETLDGTVYFARDGAPDDRSNYPTEVNLNNNGDVVTLRDASGGVVDELRYGEHGNVTPREGELVVRADDGFETRHVAATEFEPVRTHADVTGFVVPDSSAMVADELRHAEESVTVGAYTFGSDYLGDALSDAAVGGADVSVLTEGAPAGGLDETTERVLDDIDAVADLYIADGESRYRFLHGKYAAIDGKRAVVTTENFEDRNFAPDADGSRGWGVVVEDDDVARYLGEVFDADTDWRGISAWENTTVESHEPPFDRDGSVGTDHGTYDARDANVMVFVAPDAGVVPIVETLGSADDEVLVQQSYIRAWDDADGVRSNPYVETLVERADAGVDVRVHLDGRWYVEEENREVAEELDAFDNVTARLSDRPVHTKGFVLDGETVLVSSINWNENSPTNNREVGVVVSDEGLAEYFAAVFEDDWTAEDRDGDAPRDEGDAAPSDFVLEVAIIVVVSGIAVWLAAREV